MPEINDLLANTAKGILAFEVRLWFPGGSPNAKIHGYGHCQETYAKVDGLGVTIAG